MKEVVNGGYNVHPVPPPNSEIKERIMKRYETKRILGSERKISWNLWGSKSNIILKWRSNRLRDPQEYYFIKSTKTLLRDDWKKI